MSFETDLRAIILSSLSVRGSPGPAGLAGHPTGVLLIKYLNWRNRLVHPHRRQVFRSRELSANLSYAANRADVGRLLGKIAAGADVGPHLSADTLVGHEADGPGQPSRRRDLDLLLNDWGIHHLHLSHAAGRNEFNVRTDDLLFVLFRPGQAYVLDVLPHGAWVEETLVQTAVRNWPHSELFLEICGVPGHGSAGSPDRTTLRNKGGDAFIEVDGHVWMPATGGIVSAQTSLQVTRRTDRLLDLLRTYGEDRSALLRDMRAAPDNIGLRMPVRPTFRFVLASNHYGYDFAIQERSSGATLWVGV